MTDQSRLAAGRPAPGLRVDVFTIFPAMIEAVTNDSVIGRGQADGFLDIRTHDIRDHATDTHRSVDDSPYGGGAGMVMTPGPIFAAVEAAQPPRPLLYLSPAGRVFDQDMAQELADAGGFSLLCGRYEGIDERVREHLVDGEVSVGDFVLAGGEVGALVILEAVGRLVHGVLGNAASTSEESFSDGLLEYPHYTRPAEFRGWTVPDVLLSGDHARVERWRRAHALVRTARNRPDLLARKGGIGPDDRKLVDEFGLAEHLDGQVDAEEGGESGRPA